VRRADRLFALVQQLRRREIVTAAQLAERLEVSIRTVYRDVADLQASGIPIEGEAGVGYRLGRTAELPPMALTRPEIEALVLGARMVESWGDAGLRSAVRSALTKIEAVLPATERQLVGQTALYSVSHHIDEAHRRHLAGIRRAIDRRRPLALVYRAAGADVGRRTVHPLGLFHWGHAWTLAAWCELRRDHRVFRLDRIEEATTLPGTFPDEAPSTLEAFLATVRPAP
jgi:predicted DNA-binding transcriptional regulator YafY